MLCHRFVVHRIRKVILSIFILLGISGLYASENSLVQMANDPNIQWGSCPAFMGEECRLAVLHGDPAQSNSDVFFKVPGKYKIPLHWHTSAERMVLVSGKMDVTYDGEETNTLHTNSYAYGPAKKPHKAYCHEGKACILFIAFEKPIDAYEIKE